MHLFKHYGTLGDVDSHYFDIAYTLYCTVFFLLLLDAKHLRVLQMTVPYQPSAINIFQRHLLHRLLLILLDEFLPGLVKADSARVDLVQVGEDRDGLLGFILLQNVHVGRLVVAQLGYRVAQSHSRHLIRAYIGWIRREVLGFNASINLELFNKVGFCLLFPSSDCFTLFLLDNDSLLGVHRCLLAFDQDLPYILH